MLIIYTIEDGKNRIQFRAESQAAWLTQLEMTELFEDGKLDEDSVVKESLTTSTDGKSYQTLLYNLNAIWPWGTGALASWRAVPSLSAQAPLSAISP